MPVKSATLPESETHTLPNRTTGPVRLFIHVTNSRSAVLFAYGPMHSSAFWSGVLGRINTDQMLLMMA